VYAAAHHCPVFVKGVSFASKLCGLHEQRPRVFEVHARLYDEVWELPKGQIPSCPKV